VLEDLSVRDCENPKLGVGSYGILNRINSGPLERESGIARGMASAKMIKKRGVWDFLHELGAADERAFSFDEKFLTKKLVKNDQPQARPIPQNPAPQIPFNPNNTSSKSDKNDSGPLISDPAQDTEIFSNGTDNKLSLFKEYHKITLHSPRPPPPKNPKPL
jgi:hypothetical protein